MPQDATPAPDFLPPRPVRRKTLPFGAWVAIGALFAIFFAAGRPVAEVVWQLVAPGNYAAHTLDDQALEDRAGYDARFLPVLLARAHGGDKSAMFFLGVLSDPTLYTDETTMPKNNATATFWYEKSVALDDQGAERNLGAYYLCGKGVPQDYQKAAALYELSATHHHDDIAEYQLGMLLENGRGEPQDLPRAVALERAAAAQGNAGAETELGRMYMFGIGMRPDAVQAVQYWKQAAAQNDTDAQHFLKRFTP
jgi:TPR repeat protein